MSGNDLTVSIRIIRQAGGGRLQAGIGCHSMGPGPVVRMLPGRSGRRSPPPQRGMNGGDTYPGVAGSSFGPCRDFPGGGHSGFLRKSDKCVRAGVLGGAWRRGPGHANGLGLGLGHCNPLLRYSAGGGHSDFLRKSCKCVQAVSGALSLRDGMEAPGTLLLEERAGFLSGNSGTDSNNGLLEGGLPFEVVESVGTPLVRAGGVSSPKEGGVVESEVGAGLADGSNESLIGWLGPITSFPKLLVLGEESGEGGGCRRRVKGRKRRRLRRKGVLSDLMSCEACQCSGLGKDGDSLSPHCTCNCRFLEEGRGRPNSSELEEGEGVFPILSTEEQLAGLEVLDVNDVTEGQEMPWIDDPQLEMVLGGQKGGLSMRIQEWSVEGVPGKMHTLKLSGEEISILRHFSLFKISQQNVIFRFFSRSNGVVDILIFIEGEALDKKIWDIHLELGHGGTRAVFEVLIQKWYSTGLREKVRRRLMICETCLKYNIMRSKKEGMSTLLPSQSREVLQMDILGPLPNSHGYRFVLALVDGWSRFCHFIPMKTTSAEEMGKVMAKFFSEVGLWAMVKIDGKCLSMGGVDKRLMDTLGVGIIRSNYCSRVQGTVERLFQTMLRKILKVLDHEDDLRKWSLILARVGFMVNISPHSALGWRSPFQIEFRRAPSLLISPIPGKGVEGGEFQLMAAISDDIRLHAYKHLVSGSTYNYPSDGLIKGQLVWRKRKSFARHMAPKLQTRIGDAFKITDRLGTGLYRLVSLTTLKPIILPIEQLIPTRLSEAEVMRILRRINGEEEEEEGGSS